MRPLYTIIVFFISATISAIVFLFISFYIYILLFCGFLSGLYIYFLAVVEAVRAFFNRRVSGSEAVESRVREKVIEKVRNKVNKEIKKKKKKKYSRFIRICCGALLIILLVVYTSLNLDSSLFVDFLFFLGYLYLYIIYRDSFVAIKLSNLDIDNRSTY